MLLVSAGEAQQTKPDFHSWADSPPMSWNSYDCCGAAVNEAEIKGNAKMMEVHLKDAGWEYIAIDRFPSAVNGKGFR